MAAVIFNKPRSRARHNAGALLLSVSLTAAVLVVLRVSQLLEVGQEAELELRRVVLATPPPPPPPPVQHQQAQQTALQLDMANGAGTPMLDIEVPRHLAELDALTPPAPEITEQLQWQQDLDIDWSALSPDELDALPQLIALDKPVYPQALSRRNINRVVVKLDIYINEQGAVNLISVVENPYPEILDGAIRSLVRSARFTPPTQDNKPARVRFIWPVEIKQ